MKLAVIGTGYVGLVSGVCFSDFGHQVVCVDQNMAKISALRAGQCPIYEPGLEALMHKNTEAGRLSFTAKLSDAVQDAEVVFIAVGTPARRGDGHADLSYVDAAAIEVAASLQSSAVVVIKSTVPVGTNRRVEALIRDRRPDLDFDIASNPEFLREGAAIEDFMRPDRVVIGAESTRARDIMALVYRPLSIRETPILFASLESAELIKYASNAFLAMKITFINEIADLCERVGGDVQQVAKGVGLDGRIGAKFLHPGPGYGGSCFPKDTAALARSARDAGTPLTLVETTMTLNAARKEKMAEKILSALNAPVAGRKVTILGATFKPETDDMREAPSLVIVPILQSRGVEVTVSDPKGRREGEPLLPGVTWEEDAYQAASNADALVVLTEWNMFRALDLKRLKQSMRRPLMVDLRNVYTPKEVEMHGFTYISVGRSN